MPMLYDDGMKFERDVLEKYYTDTCDVYKPSKTTNNNLSQINFTVSAQSVICQLTYKNSTQIGRNRRERDVAVFVDTDASIYMPPEVDVEPGDKIVVHKFGRYFTSKSKDFTFLVVGIPKMYPTHQEVDVNRERIS